MDYAAFLERIIHDGIEAVRTDYKDQADRLKGAVAGFEACRGKEPSELLGLLQEARKRGQQAYFDQAPNYWEVRCYEAEIEWVCNCVSAILMNENKPVIVTPTARGVMKAAEVVGVSG